MQCYWQTSANQEILKFKNLSDSVSYVGIETCVSCHKDIYDSYINTGMGQSFGLATKEKSNGIFDEHAIVYDAELDYYYKPYFQDSLMYIMEYRLENGDTVHKRIEKISYIIGSGHHTNSHLIYRNGYMFQAPITFYTQEKKWDLAPGFEKGLSSRFSRIIANECLTCHNHYPEPIAGSLNKYKKMPEGIECERCHGPGSIHVKEKLKGIIVDTSRFADYSIVNPRHLPIDRQMDLCQRCHLQGVAVLNPGKSFYDFKPGMKLSEIMQVFLPRFTNSHEKFLMASQADRLRLSPCFLESKDLSCISCHNPHHDVKSKEKNSYNQSCQGCHSKGSESRCAANPKMIQKENNDCVSCHMPKTGSIDIPHVTITDHNISKQVNKYGKKVEKAEMARFLGIECLTEKNVDPIVMAEGYLALYDKFMKDPLVLDSAAFYLAKVKNKDLRYTQAQFHYLFSAAQYSYLYQRAMSHEPAYYKDGWTLYRIGETCIQMDKSVEAIPFLEAAVRFEPFQLDFQEKLGFAYMKTVQIEKAKKVFDFILSEDPKRTLVLNNLGNIFLNERNLSKAAYYIEKALSLDPDYEPAIRNKVILLSIQMKKKEAKIILEKYIKRKPDRTELIQWSKGFL